MRPRKHFHADSIVITCEHGGNSIPSRYRPLFAGAEAVLESHRGHDPGALEMARALAHAFDAALVVTTISRLLVECNRSPDHRATFSEFTRELAQDKRQQILDRHYKPYRKQVEDAIALRAATGRVLHISSHSFTPVLKGKTRIADVGLLYDPQRPGELEFSALWQKRLRAAAPDLRVRRNYPYVGWSDGLTTYLRTRHAPDRYVGIELEVNQRFVRGRMARWDAVCASLVESLAATLDREVRR